MLLIPCPWCGPRDEIEFRCGGQSGLPSPGPPEAASDAAWGEYLFFRDNPKGPHCERWLHAYGCRRWFEVTRSTVSHQILAARPLSGAAP